MPSITYTKTDACSSGGHVTLTRSGAFSGSRLISVDDVFNKPLSNDELLALEILWLRLYANGKTKPQLNTAFTAGVTLTTP